MTAIASPRRRSSSGSGHATAGSGSTRRLSGMLAQSTGWATAASECVEAAKLEPVISRARHVHPDITDVLDYASIVGGCVGASTSAGARLAGLSPTGTMPHSLVLIFGDTVDAALAFDRHIDGTRRASSSRHVQGRGGGGAAGPMRSAIGCTASLDTPSERGPHTATSSMRSVRGSTSPAPPREGRRVGGLNPE